MPIWEFEFEIYLSGFAILFSFLDVPIWELWMYARFAVWWLVTSVLQVLRFNPLLWLRGRQRQLSDLDDRADYNNIKPPFREWIADFFKSGI